MLLETNRQQHDNSTMASTPITTVGDNDVLLGRGAVLLFHPGNVMYRRVVQDHRSEYLLANRADKKHVAYKVMRCIEDQHGGRFLKRLHEDKACDEWFIADPQTTMEKVKQSLRERPRRKMNHQDRTTTPSPTSPRGFQSTTTSRTTTATSLTTSFATENNRGNNNHQISMPKMRQQLLPPPMQPSALLLPCRKPLSPPATLCQQSERVFYDDKQKHDDITMMATTTLQALTGGGGLSPSPSSSSSRPPTLPSRGRPTTAARLRSHVLLQPPAVVDDEPQVLYQDGYTKDCPIRQRQQALYLRALRELEDPGAAWSSS